MALTTLIPQIWSPRLLANLNKELVGRSVTNTDYEGEIKQYGDTVNINTLGRVATRAYTKNTSYGTPDLLNTTKQSLLIDKQTMFSFMVDDIDVAQQNPKIMNDAMKEAAYALADSADSYIFTTMVAGALVGNAIGSDATPTLVSGDTFFNYVAVMRERLNRNNVPQQGRFIVVPPELETLILLDPRFSKSGTNAGDAVARKGLVADVLGFKIYVSNNIPKGGTGQLRAVAGFNGAMTYAGQINKTESVRMTDMFVDQVRGLLTYGTKVTRPDCLVVGYFRLT